MQIKRDPSTEHEIKRIRERASKCVRGLYPDNPYIMALARVDNPDLRINPKAIYEFMQRSSNVPFNPGNPSFGTRKVRGGVCFVGNGFYYDINQWGIVYYSEKLLSNNEEDASFKIHDIILRICKHVKIAREFYTSQNHSGRVVLIIDLRRIHGWKLESNVSHDAEIPSIEPDITAYKECKTITGLCADELVDLVICLSEQILWVFNIDNDAWVTTWRQRIRDILL